VRAAALRMGAPEEESKEESSADPWLTADVPAL